MILRAIEKNGPMTSKELALILDCPVATIEAEINRLWDEGKICSDKRGEHYIPPKTSFATWLLVAFLLFVCSWGFVGLLKTSF